MIFLLLIGCPGKKQISKIDLGSNSNREGMILDPSLTFVFKPYQGKGSVKDLFNYLYFEGDTICFSLPVEKGVHREDVMVWFINGNGSIRFPAERIDLHGHLLSGFSLIGTVMEKFYEIDLQKKPPKGNYCCEGIPFTIRAEISKGDSLMVFEKKDSFKIEYREKVN